VAVTETSVAPNLNEPLDIKADLFSQFPLNLVFTVNKLAQTVDLIFGKVTYLALRADTSPSQNLPA
jgi:hypothetical protein